MDIKTAIEVAAFHVNRGHVVTITPGSSIEVTAKPAADEGGHKINEVNDGERK